MNFTFLLIFIVIVKHHFVKRATSERISPHCKLPLACHLPCVQMSSPSMMIKTHLLANGLIVFLKKQMEILCSNDFTRLIFVIPQIKSEHKVSKKWNILFMKFKCDLHYNKFSPILRPKPKVAMSWNTMPILPKALGMCVLRNCTLFFIFDHSFII